MSEKLYERAVRNTLIPEAAERLLKGDDTATDAAGRDAIASEMQRLTREAVESESEMKERVAAMTPGPWAFKKVPVWAPTTPTDGIPVFEWCFTGGNEWMRKARANARAIAAVPELIEALLWWEAAFQAEKDLQASRGESVAAALLGASQAGRAALAKATGGAS